MVTYDTNKSMVDSIWHMCLEITIVFKGYPGKMVEKKNTENPK